MKRNNDTTYITGYSEDRKVLTIGKAAVISTSLLIVIVGFLITLLISDTRAAAEKKLDKYVYESDKAAQALINQEIKASLKDLIDLHIYPEQSKKRILRERGEK